MSTTSLPRVLVIDDQFGRCQLGEAFRRRVGAQMFSLFEADRANLCQNFGLVLREAVPRDGAAEESAGLAAATFCPAQRWNDEARVIENWPEQALGIARQGWPFSDGSRWALVLLDLRYTAGALNSFGDPERGSLFGVEVLLPLLRRELGDDLPIVVLSSTARETMNATVRELGALDFIQRVPGTGAPPEESRNALRQALFLHALVPDESALVVGQSLAVLKMLRLARRGSRGAKTILLRGETGVGKGVLARYIHSQSDRALGPFETFNAAQRTADLQADELFGHWRGAFTDAKADSAGIWERATGGTLFIDEVADLDASVQARLMQPIEERRIRRLGHPAPGRPSEMEVDVRVILATNRQLDQIEGFKKDFLNRIDAFAIDIPPLRERVEDVPVLASQLAHKLAPHWTGSILPGAMRALEHREWRQGNIRELRNVLDRALTNNPAQDLTAHDLGITTERDSGTEVAETGKLNRSGTEALLRALQTDPRQLPMGDVERLKRELAGLLSPLVADLLAWSLDLTATDGKVNHTAAVRFLLGRGDISTVEAKLFLRKLLTLDTRGNQVWRRFDRNPARPRSALLDELLQALRKKAKGH